MDMGKKDMKTEKPEKWEENIERSWKHLIATLFNAPVFGLLLISIILLNFSSDITDPQISVILTLALSLVTGLLGGILAKKWDDLTDEKVLTVRAENSIRNLKLVLDRLFRLEINLGHFLGETENEVTKTYFKMSINDCVSIEKFIINAIRDWEDVIDDDTQDILNETASMKQDLFNKEEINNEDIKKIQNVGIKSNLPYIAGSQISGGTIPFNQRFDSDSLFTLTNWDNIRSDDLHTEGVIVVDPPEPDEFS